jgi:hypothetical protein
MEDHRLIDQLKGILDGASVSVTVCLRTSGCGNRGLPVPTCRIIINYRVNSRYLILINIINYHSYRYIIVNIVDQWNRGCI